MEVISGGTARGSARELTRPLRHERGPVPRSIGHRDLGLADLDEVVGVGLASSAARNRRAGEGIEDRSAERGVVLSKVARRGGVPVTGQNEVSAAGLENPQHGPSEESAVENPDERMVG